jgi:pimeloyl-ACP methyl ester carboxylesterase
MPFAIQGDVQLYFEVLGDQGLPTVLLLNGAGKQSIDAPDAFCAAIMARGFRVVRFDQRDTGLSTGFAHAGQDVVSVADALSAGQHPDLPYPVEALAADAFAVLDAASVRQVHIFGRSLGAYVAQLMALEAPERIQSMTLVMAFSRAIGAGLSRERLERLAAEQFDNAVHFATRQVETARALGNPKYFDEVLIRTTAETAFERGVPEGSIARHFMMGLAATDLRPELATLELPVQVIHGRMDKIIPLALAEETAAAIPHARLSILDDMAHEGPPQLWDRWIDLFVANTDR